MSAQASPAAPQQISPSVRVKTSQFFNRQPGKIEILVTRSKQTPVQKFNRQLFPQLRVSPFHLLQKMESFHAAD
jgi:hypothetical protein